MVIVIVGHYRSGNSLLRRVIDRHPEVTLVGEFGCYLRLNTSWSQHAQHILRRWRQRRNSAWRPPRYAIVRRIKGLNFGRNGVLAGPLPGQPATPAAGRGHGGCSR